MFETLSYVLFSVSHDQVLEDLVVREVIPAPDASRLLVVVSPFAVGNQLSPTEVLQHLHQAVGKLRAEIARSISRRKVPDLVFRLVVDGTPRGFEQGGADHE